MGDSHDDAKEKKRRKQANRMGKIVSKAWELPGSDPFQDGTNNGKKTEIDSLAAVGTKIDDGGYRLGRHGWEDFARDMGGVYNLRANNKRKPSIAKVAKTHLKEISLMLGKVDESLIRLALDHVPEIKVEKPEKEDKGTKNNDESASTPRRSSRKRKSPSTENGTTSHHHNHTADSITLGQREDNALESLANFVEEHGGSRDQVANFTCRVTRKPSDGRYDTNYYNEQNRRFRSMMEVGRYLNLIADNASSNARGGGGGGGGNNSRKRRGITRQSSSREIENEKKKLKKELDRVRRQLSRAVKATDDFVTDDKDSGYPVEDLLLAEEQTKDKVVSPTDCAAARTPDIDGFPGVPHHCIPDVIATWDFLCTFSRALNLQPIAMDDFVAALTYNPSATLAESDPYNAPPVYMAEAHLGLLKLLLSDSSSDDWWWSILETAELENAVVEMPTDVKEEETELLPLIKVDIAALLAEQEDPLITTSWMQALEEFRNPKKIKLDTMKRAIKTAIGVVANKYVRAYLKKALKLCKTSGAGFMKRAVIWLIDIVHETRPDLFNRSVSKDTMLKKRKKIVEDVLQQMDKLSSAVLAVTDDDIASDDESDDDSDESVGGEVTMNGHDRGSQDDPDNRLASAIPDKPLPTLVDLLLPPGKPQPPSDLVNPMSWPALAGAAVCRIIHRYKRLRNEVDDSLRQFRELPRLTVKERKQREALAASRVLTECVATIEDENPSERAVDHLCKGGNYLDLSTVERICILRFLIEAAYDTLKVYEVVDSNYKQRTNAVKALDTEQRRAKKEAKEKAAEDEAAARNDLANDARKKFIEEKREEIRKLNESSEDYSPQDIDAMTDDDIVSYSEDFKVDFDALPTPESFNKAEVTKRVAKMQEEAAFETHALRVMTMEEIVKMEEKILADMEARFESLGGEEAISDVYGDRETSRTIERLKKDITKMRIAAEALPYQREQAIEGIKDAIADSTIKSLKGAIRNAKTAKLMGVDVETNGIWALDCVRDAHIELENAKHLKRVADAQKDLVTKLNKCFIRTEPIGRDRFRNRFWHFDNDEQGYIWVEVDYVTQSEERKERKDGYLDLVADPTQIMIGAPDMECDLLPSDADSLDQFRSFACKEFHSSGISASLVKRHWGCHVTESSIRSVMKRLDARGIRENELKKNLKESLEETTHAHDISSPEKRGGGDVGNNDAAQTEYHDDENGGHNQEAIEDNNPLKDSGDEGAFQTVKSDPNLASIDTINMEVIQPLTSGIGQHVRVRYVVQETKELDVARYETGQVTGWKIRKVTEQVEPDDGEYEMEPETRTVMRPVWRAYTDRGKEYFLTGIELLESICRYSKWSNNERGYFEPDAAFLAYRNTLGKHCGRAADAWQSSTPHRFAQVMVKREAELYAKLKHRSFDNSWGGKNAPRNAWISSMKDYSFDFQSVRDGLLTLENAFHELTGGTPDNSSSGGGGGETSAGKALLEDPVTRNDIELESIEKAVHGIWNSEDSRSVFLEIISNCKTIGFLSLGLELICRNTRAYLNANKLMKVPETYHEQPTMRTTRRMNAWQQANNNNDDADDYDDDDDDDW